MSKTRPENEIEKIRVNNLSPNPDNPRILFPDDKMQLLQDSINIHGILVPLTVFYDKLKKKYTIIDGERRWRCSKLLKLKEVPCIIYPKPTRSQNIIYMFQIHKTRQDWELVPTALKIEVLMRTLGVNNQKEISKITGLTTARVKDCFRILEFPKKYLDLTLDLNAKKPIKGEFFSELEEWLEKFTDKDYEQIGLTKTKIIDALIEKYQNGMIPNLLAEFRNLRKVSKYSNNNQDKKIVNKEISNYVKSTPVIDKKTKKIKTKAMSAQQLYDKTTFHIEAEDLIIKESEKLYDILYKFDIHKITNPQNLKIKLKKLQSLIQEIIEI